MPTELLGQNLGANSDSFDDFGNFDDQLPESVAEPTLLEEPV
jgi:hypothetical protein